MTQQSGGSASGLPVGGVLAGSLPDPWFAAESVPAELGYVQVTANQTGISASTPTDLIGLTLTVTVGTRALIVEFGCWQIDAGSLAGAIAAAYLFDVTASAQIAEQSLNTSGGAGMGASLKARVAPVTGIRTYKVQARGDFTTVARLLASATQPAWLRINEV